mmetsp:Transcript_9525/g.19854  ORF Transcript_9525/g.19854 Transcript_9525/m.19854 type:complete len:166 (+) Transcript_9525:93-590(+)
MALSLFNEFYEPRLGRMERMLDTMLGQSFGDLAAPSAPFGGQWIAPSPQQRAGHAFDIVEKPNAFELVADAPGFKPENISVQLDNNVLTVKGQVQEERKEEHEGRVRRAERQVRSFSRTFTLPENTKPDDISANLDKGVLTVTVPKAPEEPKPEPKRITVHAPAA